MVNNDPQEHEDKRGKEEEILPALLSRQKLWLESPHSIFLSNFAPTPARLSHHAGGDCDWQNVEYTTTFGLWGEMLQTGLNNIQYTYKEWDSIQTLECEDVHLMDSQHYIV